METPPLLGFFNKKTEPPPTPPCRPGLPLPLSRVEKNKKFPRRPPSFSGFLSSSLLTLCDFQAENAIAICTTDGARSLLGPYLSSKKDPLGSRMQNGVRNASVEIFFKFCPIDTGLSQLLTQGFPCAGCLVGLHIFRNPVCRVLVAMGRELVLPTCKQSTVNCNACLKREGALWSSEETLWMLSGKIVLNTCSEPDGITTDWQETRTKRAISNNKH